MARGVHMDIFFLMDLQTPDPKRELLTNIVSKSLVTSKHIPDESRVIRTCPPRKNVNSKNVAKIMEQECVELGGVKHCKRSKSKEQGATIT